MLASKLVIDRRFRDHARMCRDVALAFPSLLKREIVERSRCGRTGKRMAALLFAPRLSGHRLRFDNALWRAVSGHVIGLVQSALRIFLCAVHLTFPPCYD